jgi:hypothetical protein
LATNVTVAVIDDGDAGRAAPSGAYFCRLVLAGEDLYRALRLQLVR